MTLIKFQVRDLNVTNIDFQRGKIMSKYDIQIPRKLSN